MSRGWTVWRATAPPPTPPAAMAPKGLRPPAVSTLVANEPMITKVPISVTSMPLKLSADATVTARRKRLAACILLVLPRSSRLERRAPPHVQKMLAKLMAMPTPPMKKLAEAWFLAAPPGLDASIAASPTLRAKSRMTALMVVRITCVHHESHEVRRRV